MFTREPLIATYRSRNYIPSQNLKESIDKTFIENGSVDFKSTADKKRNI